MLPSLSSEQLWRAACRALCPVQPLSRTACSQLAVRSGPIIKICSPARSTKLWILLASLQTPPRLSQSQQLGARHRQSGSLPLT